MHLARRKWSFQYCRPRDEKVGRPEEAGRPQASCTCLEFFVLENNRVSSSGELRSGRKKWLLEVSILAMHGVER